MTKSGHSVIREGKQQVQRHYESFNEKFTTKWTLNVTLTCMRVCWIVKWFFSIVYQFGCRIFIDESWNWLCLLFECFQLGTLHKLPEEWHTLLWISSMSMQLEKTYARMNRNFSLSDSTQKALKLNARESQMRFEIGCRLAYSHFDLFLSSPRVSERVSEQRAVCLVE